MGKIVLTLIGLLACGLDAKKDYFTIKSEDFNEKNIC